MVTHQPKDGHPPERSVLKTGNFALRLETQNEHLVTTVMDGQPKFLGGSPTNPRMVTHQKEVYY